MSTQRYTSRDSRLSGMVGRAEREMAAGRAIVALGLLHEALRMQPNNDHLGSLIRRAETMVEQQLQKGSLTQGNSRGLEAEQYLAHSTGSDSGRQESEAAASKEEGELSVETQICVLVASALDLFERNALQEAIQSLTKARLLDPSHPLVRECERQFHSIPPATDSSDFLMRAAEVSKQPEEEVYESLATTLQRLQQLREESFGDQKAGSLPHADERRLEALKRQKEGERRERDIAMWRDVARPTGAHTSIVPPHVKPHPVSPSQTRSGGFFSKVKQKT